MDNFLLCQDGTKPYRQPERTRKLDGLTGLYNHRYFYESLKREMRQAKEENRELSLLFIDIDYFKNYNDINGHQRGDEF